jgi:hypothetical protein
LEIPFGNVFEGFYYIAFYGIKCIREILCKKSRIPDKSVKNLDPKGHHWDGEMVSLILRCSVYRGQIEGNLPMCVLKPHCIQSSRVLVLAGTSKSMSRHMYKKDNTYLWNDLIQNFWVSSSDRTKPAKETIYLLVIVIQ